MYKKYNTIFIFILFIICNILTLNISPLPWIDEIFYVDVSNSLLSSSKYTLTISPQSGISEVLFYGPIYFKLQAFIINNFGLTIFNFRFLNFLSGISIIYLLYFIYNIRNWVLLLVIFSPIYIQNLHSGRMDLLATLFCIIGTIFIYHKKDLNANSIFVMTIFFILAVLTTPRVLFLLTGIYIYILYYSFSNKKFKYFTLIILSIISIILSLLLWSLFSSGTILGAYSELFSNKILKNHLGSSFFRNRLEDILILFYFLVFIYLFIKKMVNKNILIVTISLVSFLIFVKEVGPYTAMIMPFIIIGINEMYKVLPKIKLFLIFNLILFIVYFLFKNFIIYITKDTRNTQNISKFISNHIEPNSLVLTSSKYYYFLKGQDNNIITFDNPPKHDPVSMLIQLKPNYILINFNDTNNLVVKNLLKKSNYQLKYIYKSNYGNKLYNKFNLKILNLNDTYNAYLYIKKSK